MSKDLAADPENGVLLGSFSDGITLIRAGFSGGKRDGTYTVFYPNGRKCLEGEWKDGHQHGLTTTWYLSGEKRHEVEFELGVLNGSYRLWHPNGSLAIKGQYRFDEKVGQWETRDEDGLTVNITDFTSDDKANRSPAKER